MSGLTSQTERNGEKQKINLKQQLEIKSQIQCTAAGKTDKAISQKIYKVLQNSLAIRVAGETNIYPGES